MNKMRVVQGPAVAVPGSPTCQYRLWCDIVLCNEVKICCFVKVVTFDAF